jgi:hypothetical protein
MEKSLMLGHQRIGNHWRPIRGRIWYHAMTSAVLTLSGRPSGRIVCSRPRWPTVRATHDSSSSTWPGYAAVSADGLPTSPVQMRHNLHRCGTT